MDRSYVFTLIFVILALLVATITFSAWAQHQMDTAPDTDFKCRPGETYTIKECP